MSEETGRATALDPIPGIETEPTDRIFRTLADAERRVAVAYIARVDRPVSRDELVQHVATTAADRGHVDPTRRDRVETQFYHHHLPNLTSAGLLDYDDDAEVAYPTETARWVARSLLDA